VRVLGLCDDDEDDDEELVSEVQAELEGALEAWGAVVGVDALSVAASVDAADGVLVDLMGALRSEYHVDEQGQGLRRAMAGGAMGEITRGAFVDWYMRWVFVDGDNGEDDGAGDRETFEPVAGASSSGSSTLGFGTSGRDWSSVRWAVQPCAATSVEGETWKCGHCRVVNPWVERRCIACEARSEHLGSEEQVQPPLSSLSGGPSSSVIGGISSVGFTFGTTTASAAVSGSPSQGESTGSSVAVMAGGGFTFSGAISSVASVPQVAVGSVVDETLIAEEVELLRRRDYYGVGGVVCI
jgi:hypothetical protein